MRNALVLIVLFLTACHASSKPTNYVRTDGLMRAYDEARKIVHVRDSEYDGGDYWQTPTETKKRGKGDCEDVALYLEDLWNRQGLNNHRLVVGFYRADERDTAHVFDAHAQIISRKARLPGKYEECHGGLWVASRKDSARSRESR